MTRALVSATGLAFWAHALLLQGPSDARRITEPLSFIGYHSWTSNSGSVFGFRQLCGVIQKGMIRRVCQEGQQAVARHLPCRTVTRHCSWAVHTMAVWPPSLPHQWQAVDGR